MRGIIKKEVSKVLTGAAQLVGHTPKCYRFDSGQVHAWVAGSVLSQGAYKRQLIYVSLSHQCFSYSLSPSLPLSLKINK